MFEGQDLFVLGQDFGINFKKRIRFSTTVGDILKEDARSASPRMIYSMDLLPTPIRSLNLPPNRIDRFLRSQTLEAIR